MNLKISVPERLVAEKMNNAINACIDLFTDMGLSGMEANSVCLMISIRMYIDAEASKQELMGFLSRFWDAQVGKGWDRDGV